MAALGVDGVYSVYRSTKDWAAAALRHHGRRCHWCRSTLKCEAVHLIPLLNGGLNNVLNSIILCLRCRDAATIFDQANRLVRTIAYVFYDFIAVAHADEIVEYVGDII